MNVRSPRSFIPALALAGFILAAPAVVAGQDRDATKTRAQRALADIGPRSGSTSASVRTIRTSSSAR